MNCPTIGYVPPLGGESYLADGFRSARTSLNYRLEDAWTWYDGWAAFSASSDHTVTHWGATTARQDSWSARMFLDLRRLSIAKEASVADDFGDLAWYVIAPRRIPRFDLRNDVARENRQVLRSVIV